MSSGAAIPGVVSIRPIIGMEVHVELATRTKAFSSCPSPLDPALESRGEGVGPNELIDPVVLGLPGALPVLNRRAVEMSIMVGLMLGCSIARRTVWDRKNYFYPDLPKAYQISQYELPICFDGAVDVPLMDERGQLVEGEAPARVGILRAHLEEDAGKLLHEGPGGGAIDGSNVDWNRAGVPLLEIVTAPDFDSADRVVSFARQLRGLVRYLGVSPAVMQKGHMRFEPNINCVLTLGDGRLVRTPVVEVKNLNSFRSLRAAIEHELAEQPARWAADGLEMGPGRKTTRGWDDQAGRTVVQREKEDAQDYRYFPDPDLPAVEITPAMVEAIRSALPEPPLARQRRYADDFGVPMKEAAALVDDRATTDLLEGAISAAVRLGVDHPRAGKLAANAILQGGLRRANDRSRELGREVGVGELGLDAERLGALVALRAWARLSAAGADELLGLLCAEPGTPAEELASRHGLLIQRDDAAMEAWVSEAIAQHPQAASDVRAGKEAAVGRIVGAAAKLAAGKADARVLREAILRALGRG